jgi:FtsZ-binding cell division protein ZapB
MGYTRTLTEIHCTGCGIDWAAPGDWLKERRRTGANFYCPNGCCRAYHETEADKLRKEKAALENRLASARANADQLRADNDHLERSRNAYKGKYNTARKRIGKGVCPCCNRFFQNVSRHMDNKHPDYTPLPTAVSVPVSTVEEE